MNRHYIRDNEETPVYQPRLERRQRVAIIVLAVLLLVCGTLAAFKAAEAAQEPRTATISFTKPAKYTDGTDIPAGTVVTYGVYQALKGMPKTRVATITGTSTTISTGLAAGSEYCWQVSAIISGTESALSNEGCKAFAFPTPETVIITVT